MHNSSLEKEVPLTVDSTQQGTHIFASWYDFNLLLSHGRAPKKRCFALIPWQGWQDSTLGWPNSSDRARSRKRCVETINRWIYKITTQKFLESLPSSGWHRCLFILEGLPHPASASTPNTRYDVLLRMVQFWSPIGFLANIADKPILQHSSVNSLFQPTLSEDGVKAINTTLQGKDLQWSTALCLNTIDWPGKRRKGSGCCGCYLLNLIYDW